MHCIFCKQKSDQSKSVEHVIPESLGNKTIILSPGIVCDECNNYFAVKVEKPLLEQLYFQHVRFNNFIPSKKKKIPKIKGVMGGEVKLERKLDGSSHIIIEDEQIAEKISNGIISSMIVIKLDQPESENRMLSRFLAKAALETLCLQTGGDSSLISEIVNSTELDPIRNYARYGIGVFWNYHQRKLYDESDRFVNPIHAKEPYEILHELDCIWLAKEKLYFVLMLMGIEYVIDFDGPDISSYISWLEKNDNMAPMELFDDRKVIKGDPNNNWKMRYDNLD